MTAAIELDNIWKRYRIYRERYRSLKEIAIHRRFGAWDDHWVLRDVDLRVDRGTSLGLIGANGAGKSTTMKLIARILTPDRGHVKVSGRVSSLIELGAGFQPEYTGRENVFLNGSLLGMKGAEIRRRFGEIVEFAELTEYVDQPLRTYSSGMAMRLGFAVAISVDPEILLVDEVLAVGDEAFQRKCFAWFQGFQRRGGTLVLVTHNLSAVTQMCDRAAWITNGVVQSVGEPTGVVRQYLDSIGEQTSDVRTIGRTPPSVPIHVTSVQLAGGDGKIAHTLSHGEPLVVRIAYRTKELVEQPVFGVKVSRQDGLEVYSVSSAADSVRLPETAHEGIVNLSFPTLPLLTGAYLVTVTLYAGAREEETALDERHLRFNMMAIEHDSGVVRLPHSWLVETDVNGRDVTIGRG